MGAISIGLKQKPKGKISTHSWHDVRDSHKYIAIDNIRADVFTVEEFCDGYTDKEEGKKELKNYKKYGCKYVIYSRHFGFGSSRQEAINNL